MFAKEGQWQKIRNTGVLTVCGNENKRGTSDACNNPQAGLRTPARVQVHSRQLQLRVKCCLFNDKQNGCELKLDQCDK